MSGSTPRHAPGLFSRRLAGALLATLVLLAPGARADTPDFVPDAAVAQAAQASATQAVGIAKQQFNVLLDGSEASIDAIEHALDVLHTSYALASPKPPDAQLLPIAQAFGAYVGEVYRRNHGGAWGMVTLNGKTYPGLHTSAGVNVWLVGRVLNRITDGPDNNVAELYHRLADGPAKD